MKKNTYLKASAHLFSAEWKRALRGGMLGFVPIVIFAIMALEIVNDFPRLHTNLNNIMSNVGYYCFGFNFGSIVIILPFLAAFVHAPTVSEDLDGGFCIYVFRRINTHSYAITKYLACITVSALAITLGFLLFAAYCSILYAPSNVTVNPRQVLPLEDSTIYRTLYGHHGGIAFFAVHLLQILLYGAVWSGVGLNASAALHNKYVAPVAALIIYHVLTFFMQDFGLRYLDPAAMIVYFDRNVDFTLGTILFVQSSAILINGVVFHWIVQKRGHYV